MQNFPGLGHKSGMQTVKQWGCWSYKICWSRQPKRGREKGVKKKKVALELHRIRTHQTLLLCSFPPETVNGKKTYICKKAVDVINTACQSGARAQCRRRRETEKKHMVKQLNRLCFTSDEKNGSNTSVKTINKFVCLEKKTVLMAYDAIMWIVMFTHREVATSRRFKREKKIVMAWWFLSLSSCGVNG